MTFSFPSIGFLQNNSFYETLDGLDKQIKDDGKQEVIFSSNVDGKTITITYKVQDSNDSKPREDDLKGLDKLFTKINENFKNINNDKQKSVAYGQLCKEYMLLIKMKKNDRYASNPRLLESIKVVSSAIQHYNNENNLKPPSTPEKSIDIIRNENTLYSNFLGNVDKKISQYNDLGVKLTTSRVGNKTNVAYESTNRKNEVSISGVNLFEELSKNFKALVDAKQVKPSDDTQINCAKILLDKLQKRVGTEKNTELKKAIEAVSDALEYQESQESSTQEGRNKENVPSHIKPPTTITPLPRPPYSTVTPPKINASEGPQKPEKVVNPKKRPSISAPGGPRKRANSISEKDSAPVLSELEKVLQKRREKNQEEKNPD